MFKVSWNHSSRWKCSLKCFSQVSSLVMMDIFSIMVLNLLFPFFRSCLSWKSASHYFCLRGLNCYNFRCFHAVTKTRKIIFVKYVSHLVHINSIDVCVDVTRRLLLTDDWKRLFTTQARNEGILGKCFNKFTLDY